MKKALLRKVGLLFALSVFAGIIFSGCSRDAEEKWTQNTQPAESTASANPTQLPTEEKTDKNNSFDESKILIVYFSRVGNTDFDEDVDAVSSASLQETENGLEGNTEAVAKMIHNITGGDIMLIETAEKYPSDYNAVVEYASGEQKENKRPELAVKIENMEQYDAVFLGYPNWWYDMPMPVYSFIEEYDFSGKTVIPFVMHGGSGFSRSNEDLRKILDTATVEDGLAVGDGRVAEAESKVIDWLGGLGFAK